MPRTTYQAAQIAGYFLSLTNPEDNDVSNLKLQKLCYYAQGLGSAMRGTPLFVDRIEAWDHGPVVPNLYHTYKGYGSDPIPAPANFDLNQIDPEDQNALSDIYQHYAQFSAWRLRNMTHDEQPWIDAIRSADRLITIDALMDFFRPHVEQPYIARIYG